MGVLAGEKFEALLDTAVALLRRRERVTLRGLARHLDVDDDCVADIRDELVLALRVAETEEDGRVLVYRGAPQRSSVESIEPTAPVSASGERRHLTVMFCDMVGSTALSGRMDPEDLSNLLRAYQQKCASAIEPFAGHIAQYLGDGILAYFGYPRAHEDDAVRGVTAGLAIVEAIVGLNRELATSGMPEIAVRIGIHTGLVVVDEMGAGSSREHLAVGEVPNVAARLQSLGETNSVVISEATRRLVERRFTVRSRGAHDLTHGGERWQVFTVTGLRDRDPTAHRVEMVGREAEMTELQERLGRSLEGEGQVVFVRGEAGIGKSRIVSELRLRAEARGCDIHVYYASPHFTQTPLYPVAERLRRGLELDAASDPLGRIREFLAPTALDDDESVALVATFLNVEGAPESRTKNLIGDMQTLVVEWLVRNARRQPTLLVWEDLHWVDPSTLELLGTLLARCRDARVLIGATFRDTFQPPWDVGDRPPATIALGKLSRRDLGQLVRSAAAGADLSDAVLDEVLTKTDGVPLFAEELTKSLVDAGSPKTAIPSTLQDLLMARLDRLGAAKEIAQLGAAIGREFSHRLLEAVSDASPAELEDALERLTGSGLVFRYGEGAGQFYRFKHALVQDAAYEAILRGRRRPIHQRIADAMEAALPQLVDTRPELLAHHLTEAGLPERAIRSWLRAGETATERSANVEAVAHFDRGLELLASLEDETLQRQLELDLQIPRAGALRATQGFAAPATGAAFNRARDLCHQLDAAEALIPVLNGIYSFHLVRSEHDRAGAAAHELLDHAKKERNETHEMIGHRAVGAVLLHTGHPTAALDHLTNAVALYDVERHRALAFRYGTDHKETASCFVALAQYLIGRIDEAYATHREAVAHSERLAHAHSIAQALGYFGLTMSMNGDREALAELAERLDDLATREHTFPYFTAIAAFWRARARALGAPDRAAVAAMVDAAKAWLAVGGGTYQPYLLSVIGEAHVTHQPERGLPFLEQARDRIEATNERFAEAELDRIEGDLRRALGDHDEAERCYRRSLDVAAGRGIRTLQRRAAVHLAELLHESGRSEEAMTLLAPIEEGFDQGRAYDDHARATALLHELGG